MSASERNPIKTAAAYIRVSTDRQEELSPAAQKRELKNYAQKNGILITDFYQDDGISGRKAEKRPEFQKMISLAKGSDHPYDYILVWKFSRFARNQEESIVYKSLLKKNNVEVVSITEPLIEGPFAPLIERIIEWMDEYYSIRLAGDVKRGMKEKALQGGYQSAPPLGYHMGKDHIPHIYEPEAVIYREARRLCLEKNTPVTIARILNDAGFRTRRGNRFESRTVVYMLKNPFYYGMVRWNRAKHSAYRENDEKDIIIVPGVHDPLCSKDDFDKLQTLLARYVPGITGIRRKPSTDLKHYLCGLIKCPICGCNMTYQKGQSKTNPNKAYPYFVCYQYAKGIHRIGGNINAKRCEEALLDSLQGIVDMGADEIDFKPDMRPAAPSPLLDKYNAALAKLASKEQRIREAYIDGIDTKDEYRENKRMILDERTKLEQLIASEASKNLATGSIKNAEDLIAQTENLIQILRDPDISIPDKNKALAAILEHMEYTRTDDTFKFFYIFS